MTIEDISARVARWQANLLENAGRDEQEAGRYPRATADSIRLHVRNLRRRARDLAAILAILREPATASQVLATLETRRGTLLASAERLPPHRSYGMARYRLRVAADDCADTIRLLRQVERLLAPPRPPP